MLFSSLEFLLVFLPVTLAVFTLATRAGWGVALSWLSLSSLAFYAWWSVPQLFLLLVSIGANFVLGRCILSTLASRPGVARAALWVGVAANLCLLGYFKYANFFASVVLA